MTQVYNHVLIEGHYHVSLKMEALGCKNDTYKHAIVISNIIFKQNDDENVSCDELAILTFANFSAFISVSCRHKSV